MSRTREILQTIFTKPLEAIEFIVAVVLFLQGMWLVSPFYQPTNSSIAQAADGASLIAISLGAVQIVLAVFAIYALMNLRWPHRVWARKTFTLNALSLYILYGIAQIFLYQLTSVIWTTTFAIALILAVCYLAAGDK